MGEPEGLDRFTRGEGEAVTRMVIADLAAVGTLPDIGRPVRLVHVHNLREVCPRVEPSQIHRYATRAVLGKTMALEICCHWGCSTPSTWAIAARKLFVESLIVRALSLATASVGVIYVNDLVCSVELEAVPSELLDDAADDYIVRALMKYQMLPCPLNPTRPAWGTFP